MQFHSKIRLHPQRAFDLKATVIAGFMPPGHIAQKCLLWQGLGVIVPLDIVAAHFP